MDYLAFAWVKLHIPGSLPMLKRLQVGLKYLTITLMVLKEKASKELDMAQ